MLGYDVDITLILHNEDKTWVGITIDTDIRAIDAVACIGKNKIFSFFAYGSATIAYNTSVYWCVLRKIKKDNILEVLCSEKDTN